MSVAQTARYMRTYLVVAFVILAQMTVSAQPTTSAPEPAAPVASEPFGFADFTWLNGNSRETESPLDGKVFSGQFSLDTNYNYSFANPKDHTLVGSTTSGRTDEVQLVDLGVGGDFIGNTHAVGS